MSNFIKILEVRIHKSTIKKFAPNGEKNINIYYAPSRNKIDVETFVFEDKWERDEMLNILDTIL